jgi:hypothetical protein
LSGVPQPYFPSHQRRNCLAFTEKLQSEKYPTQYADFYAETKRTMAENLLKISLAIHLSKKKLEQKAKRDIKNYYGTFNGTVIEKSKKLIL